VCLIALATALVLVSAACSDDSGSSASATTAAGGAATTGASGGPTSTLDPVVGNVDLGPLAGCPFFTAEDAKAFLGTDVGPLNMKGSQVDGDTILAVCAYNDTSGVAENGVSVSAKLVPGSGANVQGDLLDLEQNRFPGTELQEIDGVGDGARGVEIAGSGIKLLIAFAGPYEIDVAAGPNQTMEEVVQLAKDTIPKLPQG
jgi:hypothetical protein